jgi:hypothetical protein
LLHFHFDTDSKYNIFMGEEVKRVKEADPGLDHKEAFTKAAGNVSFVAF